MSESEASAQITGISGGFIGTLRLSERIGKNRMVCTITITITMAGVEEVESRELL
jgi:MFS-type transporter involved in bile tolerance (Atg22 family)